jgi:50S ribosomal subunit-associated GTPase HflX
MISDVARRQEAEAQVAKMQYELVKQQAQQAEGVSDRTVGLVRGMMQDAAEAQARQMKDSMEAIQAKMETITSSARFAEPEKMHKD